VSVIDYEIDTLSQYVATYIPAADYVDNYVNEYGEMDCSAWGDFSGVVLYTMLSGHHVAAYSYDNGELTGQSFLYNPDQSPEENTTDFLAVMNGLELFVRPYSEETRSNSIALGPYWIEEITINGSGQQTYDYGFNNVSPWDIAGLISGPVILANPKPITVIGQQITNPQIKTHNSRSYSKLIFSNYSSCSDTTEICSMIEEIMNSEIGENLLKALTDKNVKTIFKFDSKYKNSVIQILELGQPTITLNKYISHKLFHELFHALQASMVGFDSFVGAKANYEVECYVATYIFDNNLDIDNALLVDLSFLSIYLEEAKNANSEYKPYYMSLYDTNFINAIDHWYFNHLNKTYNLDNYQKTINTILP